MDPDAIQSISPIAEWLGIHRETLRRWCDQGMEHVKLGGNGRRHTTVRMVARWLYKRPAYAWDRRLTEDQRARLGRLKMTFGQPTTVRFVDNELYRQ